MSLFETIGLSNIVDTIRRNFYHTEEEKKQAKETVKAINTEVYKDRVPVSRVPYNYYDIPEKVHREKEVVIDMSKFKNGNNPTTPGIYNTLGITEPTTNQGKENMLIVGAFVVMLLMTIMKK